MAKLSASTEHALSVLAHVSMANSLDKEVKGMAGFSDFYLKQMTEKDLEILHHFDSLCKTAYRDLADLFKQDMEKSNG